MCECSVEETYCGYEIACLIGVGPGFAFLGLLAQDYWNAAVEQRVYCLLVRIIAPTELSSFANDTRE